MILRTGWSLVRLRYRRRKPLFCMQPGQAAGGAAGSRSRVPVELQNGRRGSRRRELGMRLITLAFGTLVSFRRVGRAGMLGI